MQKRRIRQQLRLDARARVGMRRYRAEGINVVMTKEKERERERERKRESFWREREQQLAKKFVDKKKNKTKNDVTLKED